MITYRYSRSYDPGSPAMRRGMKRDEAATFGYPRER